MPGLDTLLPGAARPDPSAPPLAALGAMFPYLQAPTGLASMQPNAAGKIPEVDPLAGWQPMLQGAIDMASFAGPEMAAKAVPAALHLIPLAREAAYLGRGIGEHTKYQVIDDLGQHILDMNTTFNPQNKRLYVDWVGLRGAENMTNTEMQDLAAGRVGPKDMRSLLMALRNDYPEMRSLTGERISGARYAAEQYAAMKGQQLMTNDPVLRFKGPPPPESTQPPIPPAVRAAQDENARRLQEVKATRDTIEARRRAVMEGFDR